MTSRRDWLTLAAGAVLLPAAGAVAAQQRVLFGSPCTLRLPPAAPAAAAAEVWRGLAAMNARWNAWKPGDLSALNRAFAAGRPERATPALAAMIHAAAPLERASGGLFRRPGRCLGLPQRRAAARRAAARP